MNADTAMKVCRLGQGEKCCAFLMFNTEFICGKSIHSIKSNIEARLKAGAIVAKGQGDWEECTFTEDE